ncbi:hypothetical protein Tco_0155071 [Tanacetum coccineum]
MVLGASRRCIAQGSFPSQLHSESQVFLVISVRHQRLGHSGSEVLCRLVSNNFILCNKEKPLMLLSNSCLLQTLRISICYLWIHSLQVLIVFTDVDSPNGTLSRYKASPSGRIQGMDTAYFLLYVDDIVLTASSQALLRQIKKYDVDCNSSRTLVDTESKLGIDGDPVYDSSLYRSLTATSVTVYFLENKLTLLVPLKLSRPFCSTAEVEYRDVVNVVVETCVEESFIP